MMAAYSNSPSHSSTIASSAVPVVDGGIVGLIRILINNRGLLWKYPLAIGAIVLALSFLFPNTYRSTATILPPERDFQSMAQPTGDVKSFLSGGMALPLMATPSDILAAVLESRTVCETAATELDLPARWEMNRRDVLEELRSVVHAKVAPSGVILFVQLRNKGTQYQTNKHPPHADLIRDDAMSKINECSHDETAKHNQIRKQNNL